MHSFRIIALCLMTVGLLQLPVSAALAATTNTSSAATVASTNDNQFADYFGLVQQLKEHGVDPITVGWAGIRPLCIDLMHGDDQTAYNRCLYNKALDEAQFKADFEDCQARARAEYPNGLLTTAPTTVETTGVSASGTTTRITSATPQLTAQDLQWKRQATHTACMSGYGWRDAKTPLRGKR